MKKIMFAILFVMFGVASCSACAKKNTDPVTPVTPTATVAVADAAPPVTTVTIKNNNWEFTLPGPGWVSLGGECTQGTCPIKPTALMNKTNGNLVVFAATKFDGTYDELVLLNIRKVREVGATLDSTKQVDINGHKFALIEATKGNVKVWSWVTLVQGQGYGLSCGGAADDASQHDLCFGIANTIKIN